MRYSILLVGCLGWFLPSYAVADGPKLVVKRVEAELPSEVPPAITSVLDPQAYRVGEKDSDPSLTIWFRKVVPVSANVDQIRNGLTYHEIPDGTFLGIIHFAKDFTDFRKQAIPAGTYSFRFALQPETGDHMGTAPHPEFVLLTPIEKDPSPKSIETKKLIEQSSTITEGDHPAVMLLFPNYGKDAEPKLVSKDGGIVTLQLRRPIEANGTKSTLGFSLVVAGVSKSR